MTSRGVRGTEPTKGDIRGLESCLERRISTEGNGISRFIISQEVEMGYISK